nr:MAG TPA: hypothetical protein [Bacteriophage sp.]
MHKSRGAFLCSLIYWIQYVKRTVQRLLRFWLQLV